MEAKSIIFLFMTGLAICSSLIPASSAGPGYHQGPEYLTIQIKRAQTQWDYIVILQSSYSHIPAAPSEPGFIKNQNGANLERVASNRILDGQLANEGQFPYAVSIQLLGLQGDELRGHICGGALYTRSHVVTVASCLYDQNSQIINAANLRVFAGAVHLTNDSSSDRVRAVSNFTVHPQFTGPPALVNNIAVLTLASEFPATAVTPASLPSSNFNPADFTTCTVTGWGGNDAASRGSVQLRYANKYIYNQNLCMTLYNSMPGGKNILPSMVCSVSLDLLSSNCLGDYGNPLVCGGTFTGILSQSDGCSGSSYPEIYTRISNHTSWLRSVSGASAIYAPGVFVMIAAFSLMQMYFTA